MNKYEFLRDLEASILDELPDDINEFINEQIDNECIYYADCFDILKELHHTDWSRADIVVTNVSQAAYMALYELVYSELDISGLEEKVDVLTEINDTDLWELDLEELEDLKERADLAGLDDDLIKDLIEAIVVKESEEEEIEE